MQHHRLVFVDAHAGLEQAVVVVARHQRQPADVGLRRQQQAHVHAALCGLAQQVGELCVRREIALGDPHTLLRVADGVVVGAVDDVALLALVEQLLADALGHGEEDAEQVGALAGEHADDVVAGVLQRREVLAGEVDLALRVLPGFQKGALEGRHRRTLDLDVRVAPAGARCQRRNAVATAAEGAGTAGASTLATAAGRRLGVLVHDVDAAGEGDTAVHHQQLAVAAAVDAPDARVVHAMELVHLHARVLHSREIAGARAAAADAIEHQPHDHAGTCTLAQGLRVLLAELLVGEDVDVEVDVVLRGADRRQLRAVRGGAIDQQIDLVAGGRRPAGEGGLGSADLARVFVGGGVLADRLAQHRVGRGCDAAAVAAVLDDADPVAAGAHFRRPHAGAAGQQQRREGQQRAAHNFSPGDSAAGLLRRASVLDTG